MSDININTKELKEFFERNSDKKYGMTISFWQEDRIENDFYPEYLIGYGLIFTSIDDVVSYIKERNEFELYQKFVNHTLDIQINDDVKKRILESSYNIYMSTSDTKQTTAIFKLECTNDDEDNALYYKIEVNQFYNK